MNNFACRALANEYRYGESLHSDIQGAHVGDLYWSSRCNETHSLLDVALPSARQREMVVVMLHNRVIGVPPHTVFAHRLAKLGVTEKYVFQLVLREDTLRWCVCGKIAH
ncbi:hypothetical protein LCGC14_0323520 [marine sediment metagenome]|uniref:Uncharacterized protein n=1 Tax=marine sediment metagenome TaxID=412755 RepID=A0A0F9WQW1_9ZZZZ